MRGSGPFLNPVVAAIVLFLSLWSAGLAQDLLPVPEGGGAALPAPDPQAAPDVAPEPVAPKNQAEILDQLFTDLANPDNENWAMTEQNIWIQWSRSGSPAMDLLLERGRLAMAAGDYQGAIEHLTALIDHAPDFAEGWNARATAYFQAGQFGPSIEDVRHVLALNPRHFGAMAGLGMMLEELHYDKDALEAYEAARAIHPHSPGVLQGIERLHKKLDGQDI